MFECVVLCLSNSWCLCRCLEFELVFVVGVCVGVRVCVGVLVSV